VSVKKGANKKMSLGKRNKTRDANLNAQASEAYKTALAAPVNKNGKC
jgi:hypothetical protein